MIETPPLQKKHDRLTAFLKAFGLRAVASADAPGSNSANLFVIGDGDGEGPTHIFFRVLGGPLQRSGLAILAAAKIDFGGAANPLVGALPEELVFSLEEQPQMRGLADILVAEVENSRCGGGTVQDRICEIIVVLAVRRAIDQGTVNAGLLAGLAHPTLHPCLVAVHDDPARQWRTDVLARLAGMSRSHFVTLFTNVVGMTPTAYLTAWRLALGRAALEAGSSVKTAAALVGFGSAAAFSRAFSRKYGYPPVGAKRTAAPRPA
ncbi:AraC family transcriptional regulator (plasmid) [Sinorhizobium chiapasense]|uniref:helix-turn-helix transcriptional regulator n=1 Tax=Sinorhizobium chiapasense TaxID=501572 RepID=UPI002FE39DF2